MFSWKTYLRFIMHLLNNFLTLKEVNLFIKTYSKRKTAIGFGHYWVFLRITCR